MTNDNTPATAPTYNITQPLPSPKMLATLLEKPDRSAELAALLDETGIPVKRFIRTVVHAYTVNEQIRSCSGESILLAVLDAARMGLEPTGQYGGAYLVKRGGKATMEVDYRGFIRMAVRSGAIKRAIASPVYAGDLFEWEEGTNPYIKHVPTQGPARGGEDRGDLTHVYAIAWLPDGTPQFRVMERAEVNAIMARTSSKKEGKVVGPWVSDYVAMALKTVVRQLFKWMPAVYNPALQYALEREDELAPLDKETHEEATPAARSRRDMVRDALAGEEAPEPAGEQPATGTPDEGRDADTGPEATAKDEPAPGTPADDPDLPDVPETPARARRRPPARGRGG